METILITGGTGLIGSALSSKLLEKGYAVILLSRSGRISKIPGLRYAAWDPAAGTISAVALSSADHLIHLAGESIGGKRWTKRRKKEIVVSRTRSSEVLVAALKTITNHVRTVVSASAIGWYGEDPTNNTTAFVESDPPGTDFLAKTCEQWEMSVQPMAQKHRLVILRTGVVLSKKGGALTELRKPLKFGVAPILGSGRQTMSWIHIDDLVRLYIKSIEDTRMNGVYNAVSPFPVGNRNLMEELSRQFRSPLLIRVPSFLLKMILGEMANEVLKSATVSSIKIVDSGFNFEHPQISDALQSLK